MRTTDCSGMFIYKDDHIDYIQTSEGRLKWDDHDHLFYAEYFIKDHLGNVRDVITTNPNTSLIRQVTDYYPFGLEIQEINATDNLQLYNSKELQTDAKLWWYDYGARFYDPVLGRFTGIDPLAEKFYHLSPYNYADNSPIANIDLWGLQAWYAADGSIITKPFSNEPAAGPLSTATAKEIGATQYGVLESRLDYSFSNKEIRDFSDWNATGESAQIDHLIPLQNDHQKWSAI